MEEFVIANDEGVLEDGFCSRESAEKAMAAKYAEDDAFVELAENYDDDGNWIEEADGDEDDEESDDN